MKNIFSSALIAASLLLTPALNQAHASPKAGHLNVSMPRPFESLVRKLAEKDKVPVNLVHAVIHTESNYNTEAKGDAGEVGLMQLMPMTARGLGFKGPLTELYAPEKNLEYGIRYLAKAHKLGHGDICRTILKYNAGYGAKKMNPISKRYCEKVKTYLASVGS